MTVIVVLAVLALIAYAFWPDSGNYPHEHIPDDWDD